MIETLLVLGVVGLLIALGCATVLLSLGGLLAVGAACIGVGFVIGVPAGAYYHVKLYRELALQGPVPREFWWRPTRFHGELEAAQWRRVLPWFVLGGGGFVLIVAGALVVLLGVLRAR